jgi:hypothetical protein
MICAYPMCAGKLDPHLNCTKCGRNYRTSGEAAETAVKPYWPEAVADADAKADAAK